MYKKWSPYLYFITYVHQTGKTCLWAEEAEASGGGAEGELGKGLRGIGGGSG